MSFGEADVDAVSAPLARPLQGGGRGGHDDCAFPHPLTRMDDTNSRTADPIIKNALSVVRPWGDYSGPCGCGQCH
jgi:hypothetical protein